MNRLKDIEVEFISLVEKPANELSLILKGGHNVMIEFKKYDEDRQVAYGIVYAPELVDAQGDFADRFEIEKAAYNFMRNKRVDNVDLNHSFKPVPGCYVCESWIVKEGDPYFYDKVGAWAVGIKVESKEVWQMLKDGKLKGLSMAGKAEREMVKKDEEGIVKMIVDGIKSILNKHKEDKMAQEDLKKAVDERSMEIISSVNARFDELIKELKEKWENFQKSVNDRIECIEKARVSQANAGEVKKSIAEEIL